MNATTKKKEEKVPKPQFKASSLHSLDLIPSGVHLLLSPVAGLIWTASLASRFRFSKRSTSLASLLAMSLMIAFSRRSRIDSGDCAATADPGLRDNLWVCSATLPK